MSNLPLNLLQQEIDYIVANDDFQGAFEAYNLVKGWLDKNGIAKSRPQEYAKYYSYLIKFKFLSLNFFDDVNDYYDLLKNYFSLSQEIKDFDLWSKLELQLLCLSDLDARDAFKNKLKEALEKSEEILISRQKYPAIDDLPRKVSDWIKDFVANLGLDNFDNLRKMEYLANGKYVKLLTEDDKNKVKNLLDIYEKLKLSSRTPQGYENAVAMNIDGKEIIFDHGEVQEVTKEDLQKIKNVESNDQSDDDLIIKKSPALPPSSAEPSFDIPDLEQALSKYPPTSLEYKALSQEISRLKRAALKTAQQKSHAQK